jgi:hypothetical protein
MQAGTKICIPWTRLNWNEACAWAIEQYGLPDERFTTHPSEDGMYFYFKDECDAIIFELTWG